MSKDHRHGPKARRDDKYRRKPQGIVAKLPRAKEFEAQLRHAVRNRDTDAFENYDEPPVTIDRAS